MKLLGRIGWPVVFFLVAGLVFAGLGWVTYAALKVEHAHREAAARAELGNNLRDALWRLDGSVILALGAEDSRPFYHYESADPAGNFGNTSPPLLVATLPDWIRLHFQLDPTVGWTSTQAPADQAEAERIRTVWGDLPNFYGGREVALAELKNKFPVRTTCELFAARDRAIPAGSLPFDAHRFTEVNSANPSEPNATPAAPTLPPESGPKPPPPADPAFNSTNPAPNPVPQNCDTIHVLGFDLCLRPLDQQQADNNFQGNSALRNDNDNSQKRNPDQGKIQQRAMPPQNVTMRGGGRMQQNDAEERGWLDYVKRAQTFGKGLVEAKDALYGPNFRNPMLNNYSQQGNSQNSLELKNGLNTIQQPAPQVAGKNDPGLPTVPVGPPALPGGVPGVGPSSPVPGPVPAAKPEANRDRSREKVAKDSEALKSLEADMRAYSGYAADVVRFARLANEWRELGMQDDLAKKYRALADETAWFGWFLRRDDNRKPQAAQIPSTDGKASVKPLAPAVPGEDRPPQPPPVVPPSLPVPMAVHVGSLRPQWVTGPDGTEVLMLVRTVRLEFKNMADNKTVYQGIVIDWPKLEAKLKDEVKDLFPDARLAALKEPDGVSPERAMTALPVQLHPGSDPKLPPAGWTPLRIGLSIAWAAAIIAVLAVGFSGWSLIDLAERRFRFVSAVTHELRTPLTSLRLYLDLLLSGMIEDEAKRQEYLNTLATESDRLHRLIDNVLDFARLEKRRKNGDAKPVKVCEIVNQLRLTWTDRVAQDGKELIVISTLPPECEVRTDLAMIQQIVGNLIDNARKYARDAADRRIWLWAKQGQGNTIILEVEDRGPGVPPSERRSIFKPFRRGEHADSVAGGAGLGLALAKSWAEVLNARLTYRPAECGTGACFRLEIPGK